MNTETGNQTTVGVTSERALPSDVSDIPLDRGNKVRLIKPAVIAANESITLPWKNAEKMVSGNLLTHRVWRKLRSQLKGEEAVAF